MEDMEQLPEPERAVAYARAGCSCAESIGMAFAPRAGLDPADVQPLVSGLAGGMGLAGETCGVLAGGMVILGQCLGPRAVDDQEGRVRIMAVVTRFRDSFLAKHGSTQCAVLNGGLDLRDPEQRVELRKTGRPEPFIRSGAELLAAILDEAESGA